MIIKIIDEIKTYSICVSAILWEVFVFKVIFLLVGSLSVLVRLLHQIFSWRMFDSFPSHVIVLLLLIVSLRVLFFWGWHLIIFSEMLDFFSVILVSLTTSWFQSIMITDFLGSSLFFFVSVSSFALSFDKQWSIKDLCIYFYHFFFIFPFTLPFLLFKLLDFGLNHGSGMSYISQSAFFQYISDIRGKLLLPHFPYCWGPFLLLYLLILVHFLFLS